jgi:hypothetical protein
MPLLKEAHRQSWSNSQLKLERGARALRALDQAGIRTLVLKGAAVGRLYYDSVGARPMDDFDVAVPSDDAPLAVGVLESAGFRPMGERARERIIPLTSEAFFDLDVFGVDLHATVLWQPEADELFWPAAVPLRIRDVETHALCATDQLIHACMHASRWHSVVPIRSIADAMMVLRRSDAEVDWQRLELVAAHARLGIRLAVVLEHLRRDFDAPVPEHVPPTLRAARLSAVERHAHRTITRPPSIRLEAGLLSLFWVRYSGFARMRSERPGAPGFMSYLQRFWGLPSRRAVLWRAPAWLTRLALSPLRREAARSDRARGPSRARRRLRAARRHRAAGSAPAPARRRRSESRAGQ